MEGILGYVCLVLLFLVYATTMLVDCETFQELNMSEVREGIAKRFLLVRRARVGIGRYLLLLCTVRIGSYLFLIPAVNIICWVIKSDIRIMMVLAPTEAQWLVCGICVILLVVYMMERQVKERMMEEWAEDGN